jgi:hypothetical protein
MPNAYAPGNFPQAAPHRGQTSPGYRQQPQHAPQQQTMQQRAHQGDAQHLSAQPTGPRRHTNAQGYMQGNTQPVPMQNTGAPRDAVTEPVTEAVAEDQPQHVCSCGGQTDRRVSAMLVYSATTPVSTMTNENK